MRAILHFFNRARHRTLFSNLFLSPHFPHLERKENLPMSKKFTDDTSSSKSNIQNSADKNAGSDLSKLLRQDLDFVKKSFQAVKDKASQVVSQVDEAHEKFENLTALPEGTAGRDYQLRELKKEVSKLKFQIPFNLIIPPEQPNPHIHRRSRSLPNNFMEIMSSNNNSSSSITLPHHSLVCPWINPPADHELLSKVNRDFCSLKELVMLCLLAFPENAVIKRSILYNWVYTFEATTSKGFDKAINGLIAKCYVEAVYKPNLTLAGYRVHPPIYSIFKRNKNSLFTVWLSIRENCFGPSLDEEKEDIYYSEETCEDIIASKSLEMLYLGRWNDSSTQHTHVVIDPKLFFKDMSKLDLLKFVSLRGISMIEELPEFITKLKWLQILDLKACYNLEVIPSSISSLQYWLMHLDMSECYLLEHMPKSIAMLVELKVLKGFYVGENQDGNSCSVEDLVSLQRLEKLNIYTSVREFPNKSQLKALQSLPNLINLTISWGGCSTLNPTQKSSKADEETAGYGLRRVLTRKGSTMQEETFHFHLWKLDLQCVPEGVTRSWLKPTNFKEVKNLYIRGGQFNDLSNGNILSEEGEFHKWNNVEILRLKHLSKVKLDWSELRRIFPKLSCLEKVNCPNLVGFPCDDNGVWQNEKRLDCTTFISFIGGAFHDSTGRWLSGYSGMVDEQTSSLNATIWSVHCGLQIILRNQWKNVKVYTDSAFAVECITQGEVPDDVLAIVNEVRFILQTQECSISYIPRKQIKMACVLADKVFDQTEPLLLWKELPRVWLGW